VFEALFGRASISNAKDEFIGITFGGSSKPDMPTDLERKWVGGGGPRIGQTFPE